MAPFWALKHAPPAMLKTNVVVVVDDSAKGVRYDGAVPKEVPWGSIVVVSSVASTYGGCWGPCFTMSSHAALGVVRAGVASLKGESLACFAVGTGRLTDGDVGTGVRINCVSPGQIDMGIDLKGFDMRGMSSQQLPPSSLQTEKVSANVRCLELWS